MSNREKWDFFLAHAKADLPSAEALYELLARHSRVFLDSRCLQLGDDWDRELVSAQSESLITVVLVSLDTDRAYYLREEIANAIDMSRRDERSHRVVPVYLGGVDYAEGSLLYGLRLKHGLTLSDKTQYPEVAQSLLALLRNLRPAGPGVEARQPPAEAMLDVPGSVLSEQSAVYVKRPCDALINEIRSAFGRTYFIKGPHQSGKTCLLTRTMLAAVEAGKRVVHLDLQRFDTKTMSDSEAFYRSFCAHIADELGLEDEVNEVWKAELSSSLMCTRYLKRHVLRKIPEPLVLAIDEADVLFDTTFAQDVFGTLRSWHSDRTFHPEFRKLDLLLAHTSDPSTFIASIHQSPFHIGETFELSDFTPQQVSELNRRLGSPLSPNQEQALIDLVGGHPYLTHMALYSVARGRISAGELLSEPTGEGHVFASHLRQLLLRVVGNKRLADGLKEVLRSNSCRDWKVRYELKSAGLVHVRPREVAPRCRLYADFFRAQLS